MRLTSYVSNLWSPTDFPADDLKAYAQRLMAAETRGGVMTVSLVCAMLLSATALAILGLGIGELHVYTYAALATLSLHIYFSARTTRDTKAHHLLGMTLLVVCGAAVVLLAHRTGELHPVMFATIGLLFMVVPAVPWGLREASRVIGLIYFIFTVSTLSMAGRFAPQQLWALQLFMVSCAVIAVVLVTRSVQVRKKEIRTRFDLEAAQRRLEELANRDPLTGVLNRRALEPAFRTLAEKCARERTDSWFCALDIDHFKRINDRNGHDYGDQVLNWMAQVLHRALLPGETLVRTGGDEFVLMLVGADPRERIHQAMADLQNLSASDAAGPPLSFRVGLKRITPDSGLDLEESYRMADRALYAAKRARDANPIVEHDVSLDLLPEPAKGHDSRWQKR